MEEMHAYNMPFFQDLFDSPIQGRRTVPTLTAQGHAHAVPRLAIAVVTVVVACASGSVWAFLNAVMNEPRAALPAGDVSVASWVVSRVTYPFKAASAWDVDSVCSGSRTATTPELILLMVTQSAADGLVEELAAVELAGAEADADVAEADAAADVAGAVGVELDDELDESAARDEGTARG